MTKRNQSVDIAKFIAAIFVIGIHTRPLSVISGWADFFLCDIIFRTAVPFFAVCTGFYLTNRMDSNNKVPSWSPVKSMILKTSLLYVAWSLFYLLILAISWCQKGLFTTTSIIGWFKSFLIGSPYYHLWYLAQLFWALLFFYPIVRYVPRKMRYYLTFLLWLIGSFAYVYSDILEIGQSFVRSYDNFGAITGSVVRMLPLILTGNLIAESKIQKKEFILLGVLVCFAGLVVEAYLLRKIGAEKFSYIIFTLPLAFYLFLLIQGLDLQTRFNTRLLSKVSMNIYLLHPAMIFLIVNLCHSSYRPGVLFLMVTAITISICLFYDLLTNRSSLLKWRSQ